MVLARSMGHSEQATKSDLVGTVDKSRESDPTFPVLGADSEADRLELGHSSSLDKIEVLDLRTTLRKV